MTDSSPTEITFNLYCVQCGYNLRGLTGDPVRCPECGEDNAIYEPPAIEILRHLDQLTQPVRVIRRLQIAIVIAAFVFLACAPHIRSNSAAQGVASFACLAVVIAAGLAAFQYQRFRWNCEGDRKALLTFARQQRFVVGYALTLMVTTAAIHGEGAITDGALESILIVATLAAAGTAFRMIWRRERTVVCSYNEALYEIALEQARRVRLDLMRFRRR